MNVSNLELILVQKISNSTSTLDTLIYSKALQELKTGTITVVNSTSDLPNPNKNFIGHLFYEKLTEAMYLVDKLGFARKIEASVNLYTWGCNNRGQLGEGSTTDRCSPVSTIRDSSRWLQVAVTQSFNTSVIAIKNDGTLWTWGDNNCGQLGSGSTASRSSPGSIIGGGTTWCAIAAGYSHVAAIKTDGTLWSWGDNSAGQLGDGTVIKKSIANAIAFQSPSWSKVFAGCCHTIGIKIDGTLWTWGNNDTGQLGDGTTSQRSVPTQLLIGGKWICAAGGKNFTVAIKDDNTLWTWGDNEYGQLGSGTYGYGSQRSSPGTTAGGGANWCSVSAGYRYAAGIKTDGTLWTWGLNSEGRLGDGTTTQRTSPVTTAGGGTNWCAVSASGAGGTGAFTAAVKSDGTLWTWGQNSTGQLGTGNTTSRSSPGTIAGGITDWSKVSVSGTTAVAIRAF